MVSSTLSWLTQASKSLSQQHLQLAQKRQALLTKPAGSLGAFELLAIRLAAMQATQRPSADNVSINIFAADHGIAAEGVSAFPQAVTAEMIKNFARGGAAICVAAKQNSANLHVWNLGTVAPVDCGAVVKNRIIAPQTANFAQSPAMSSDQLNSAMLVGVEAAESACFPEGLFIGGEMGIANTSAATAIAAVLLGCNVSDLVGPGTGLNADGVKHKASVIDIALKRHNLSGSDALQVLKSLGGFEIAALVAGYIRCAQLGIPVIVDGFICTVAALVAYRINPSVLDWFIFSHQSAEPGYQLLIKAFPNQVPLLDLGMRLGEGSGAAACIPLIRLACAWHNDMATFGEAAVSEQSEY